MKKKNKNKNNLISISPPAPPASSLPSLPEPPVPVKIYPNSYTCKAQILSENKNKSGIYMWKNSINDKRYIGSSENLKRRFREYFNNNYLLNNNYMAICCALIKHGYSHFSLSILEYCSPEKCLIREKHYWDLLPHEYNIEKEPGAPFSGRKHYDETKIILSDAKKGITRENNQMYGKNHSEETKKIMSDAKKGQQRLKRAGRPSQQIEVTDIKNNITTSYDSIGEAARALNLTNFNIIRNYILRNQQKPYKGRYTFTKK